MSSTATAARVDIVRARRSFSATGDETGLVVEELDLKIEPGEFVSLLGPSGCGKSTLLRMIAGLDAPDSGTVRVTSQTHDAQAPGFRGFVFQEPQLLPWRTAIENVALPLQLMRKSRTEAKRAAEEALLKVNLGDSFHKFPAQLSGGMKMRVSVARALVAEPKLLLLDEPFAALDENTRFRLQEELRLLWQQSRMTVIFVTHSVSEAAFLSDRAIVFSSRPARVLLDRATQLSFARNRQTRTDATYFREIEALSAAFRNVETR